MIVDLPNTTISKVSKSLVKVREQGGAVALGRVLTLIIETNPEGAEEAIAAANAASREHPCRIIALIDSSNSFEPKLDAEIRVGGDAGASEVIVLKPSGAAAFNPESLVTGLLLPDAPVVAWWPNHTPSSLSNSPIGKIATRRISDSLNQPDPIKFLESLATSYAPGDSDFAWTRLTLWRAQLAAILDQPPFEEITAVEIEGDSANPSVQLLAAWLKMQLGCPLRLIQRAESVGVRGIYLVRLQRASGSIEIIRDKSNIATLTQTGQPPKELSLPVRSLRDCLAEDLRRLDPDSAFERVIKNGLPMLSEK
ncbi:MAG: glucose-6-phosphate dehydrogenase assembly protein OpcA [Actinomycetota bacterium]